MKRTILTSAFLLVVICSYLNKSVQAQEISGVEILPEYPTSADDILFVVSTTFPLQECRLDSLYTSSACGAFSYDAFYGTSFDIGDCERSDTIHLGQLQNGFYPITYRMYFMGWSQVDQVDTVVTVGAVGLSETDKKEKPLKIWPNPSSGMVNIVPGSAIDRIHIHTSSGQLVETYEINKRESEQISISLAAGLYICTPIRDGLPLRAHSLIVRDN
jgi:hypothetical protein